MQWGGEKDFHYLKGSPAAFPVILLSLPPLPLSSHHHSLPPSGENWKSSCKFYRHQVAHLPALEKSFYMESKQTLCADEKELQSRKIPLHFKEASAPPRRHDKSLATKVCRRSSLALLVS